MLVSYPNLRYLSACSLPIRVRVDAWELPTHGRGDQSQHLTAVLHKLCSGLQPGRGTKLSPLSLLAAKTGQNSPCMHQTAQNARILASRANFVTRAPQTVHAGRILSRKTLRSGTAGRVPSRLQLRGRTLTSVCAHKTLDIDVGSTAHTHIIGPTCRSWVIGHFVLLGLVPGVVVGGGVVEFVEADCVAPAGDDAGGLVGLAGVVPGIFEGCVGGHGRQDPRCWLRVS